MEKSKEKKAHQMLKRLSLDHRPSGQTPQRLSRSCKRNMTQQTFCHYLIKRRYAHTWRLYFSEEAKKLNATNSIRARICKQSKSLQKLKLLSFGTSDKALLCLSQYFKGFVSLKSLSLDRPASYNNLTNAGLCHLSQGLKNLSSLQSLDFNIMGIGLPSFTDNSLDILRRGLRIHISLRNIRFSFSKCDQITNSGIKNLCSDLKNLVFLQSLYLEFDSCDIISGEGLLAIQKLRKKLKRLKQVKFVWRNMKKVSLIQVKDLLQIFEVFDSPQNLTINLSSNLWKITLNTPQQDLQLEIHFGDINTEINNLMKLLNKFSATKDISLKFQGFCKVHETGARRMSHALTITSTNIKLLIDAEIIDEISNNFYQFLQGLTNLKYLGFEFCKCQYYKVQKGEWRTLDDFVKELYEQFISLDNPHQILEKELEGFKSQISIQKEIFSPGRGRRGRKVGAIDMKSIILILERTVTLEEFSLKVCSKDILTNAGRKKIAKALKNHKSLQKANIEIGGDVEILEVQKDREEQGENESNSLFTNFLNKVKKYCFWLCCESHAN